MPTNVCLVVGVWCGGGQRVGIKAGEVVVTSPDRRSSSDTVRPVRPLAWWPDLARKDFGLAVLSDDPWKLFKDLGLAGLSDDPRKDLGLPVDVRDSWRSTERSSSAAASSASLVGSEIAEVKNSAYAAA